VAGDVLTPGGILKVVNVTSGPYVIPDTPPSAFSLK